MLVDPRKILKSGPVRDSYCDSSLSGDECNFRCSRFQVAVVQVSSHEWPWIILQNPPSSNLITQVAVDRGAPDHTSTLRRRVGWVLALSGSINHICHLSSKNANETLLQNKAQGIPQTFPATNLSGKPCQYHSWAVWSLGAVGPKPRRYAESYQDLEEDRPA